MQGTGWHLESYLIEPISEVLQKVHCYKTKLFVNIEAQKRSGQ